MRRTVSLSNCHPPDLPDDFLVLFQQLDGQRDLDLLKSAVAMPQATFDGEFLHTDIFEMAAAYLFHIVGNHPFLDGNKRVGAVACLVFLELNGYEFTAPEKDLSEIVFALARGEVAKADVAIFVRNWTTRA